MDLSKLLLGKNENTKHGNISDSDKTSEADEATVIIHHQNNEECLQIPNAVRIDSHNKNGLPM